MTIKAFRTGCVSTIKLRAAHDYGDGTGHMYETLILPNHVHGQSEPVRAGSFLGAAMNHLRALAFTVVGKVEEFA